MAPSPHECKCRTLRASLVNFIPPEFKSTELALKNMPEPVWYDDQTFWYLHCRRDRHRIPDLELSWLFLRDQDIFRKTSYFLVFLTFKERPLKMKPLIYMATFEWFDILNSVSLLHLSCQAIYQFAWSHKRSLYRSLSYNLMLVLAASVY